MRGRRKIKMLQVSNKKKKIPIREIHQDLRKSEKVILIILKILGKVMNSSSAMWRSVLSIQGQ